MASKISDLWVHTTLLIENDRGERRTGFFVSQITDETDDLHKVFIVINKHAINGDPSLRQQAQSVNLGVNVQQSGKVVGKTFTYPLYYSDGKPDWHGHPDDDVDVLAIDATLLVNSVPELDFRHAIHSAIAGPEIIERERIAVGDEVVVVGYPLGLRQGQTNYPLVRQGMLATNPGQGLYDEATKRTLRGFLIDGATVPGSSGSTVLLKPVIKSDPEELLTQTSASLLGIVAETRYSPTKTPTGHVLYGGRTSLRR